MCAEHQSDISDKDNYFLCANRVSKEKGMEDVVKAFADFHNKNSSEIVPNPNIKSTFSIHYNNIFIGFTLYSDEDYSRGYHEILKQKGQVKLSDMKELTYFFVIL